MPIDKLLPQYLNQDEDARLIKPVEMVDALNVRIDHDGDGDSGVLKNVQGNEAVPARGANDAIPTEGENRIIGSVSSEASKCIYFFLYNSEGDHGIYRYSVSNNWYAKLYEDDVLNFSRDSYVKADVVINQYQEDLLYFTDGNNEPRKINATRALQNAYNDELNTGTDFVKNLYLTTCKRPPQDPITFEFLTDEDVRHNHLKESCFQFAYQYVYDDGEVSALSIYSALAISPTNLAYDQTTTTIFESANNALRVTVQGSDGPVRRVRVFARKNNDQAFYKIEELDNVPGAIDFVFLNDKSYPLLSEEEANKLYDAVPRSAYTQAFSNNRLFYGDYVEGFPNIETSSMVRPVYHNRGTLPTVTGSVSPRNVDHGDTADYRTALRVFGDIPAGEHKNKGLQTDAVRRNVDYNDYQVRYPNFDIDTSQIPDNISIEDGSVTFFVSIAASEIAFHAVTFRDNTNEANVFDAGAPQRFVPADAYFKKDIYVGDSDTENPGYENNGSDEEGNSGVLLLAPFVVDGNDDGALDSYSFNNLNAMMRGTSTFKNLKPENNIEFSVTFSVQNVTSKTQLINQIRSNLVGLVSNVAVKPSATPDDNWNNSTTGSAAGRRSRWFNGLTTMGYFMPTDGNFQDNLTNDRPSRFCYLWFQGNIEFTILSTTYDAGEDSIKAFYYRTDFDLQASHLVHVQREDIQANDLNPLTDSGWPGENDTLDFDYADSDNATFSDGLNNNLVPSNADGGSEDGKVRRWVGLGAKFTLTFSGSDVNNNSSIYDATGTNRLTPIDNLVRDPGGECGAIITSLRGVDMASFVMRIQENVNDVKTFKSAASHDFGVVYYDDRNRPSFVQKIATGDVPRFGAAERLGYEGRALMDIRLTHTPPPWATKWAPVYTKNTTYEMYLQCTVAEAALPSKSSFTDIYSGTGSGTRPVIGATGGVGLSQYIMVSLRTLEGKVDSYKESKGADVEYKFLKGDKLRIIEYVDPSTGAVVRPYSEFTITDFKYFQDDDENPTQLYISDGSATAYRRTGWWLILRDDGVANFDRQAISAAEDFWSQSVLVEIFRVQKKMDTQVYYEVGEQRDIITVNNVLTHAGDRAQDDLASFAVLTLGPDTFQVVTNVRLYPGDRVLGNFNSLGAVAVANVYIDSDGTYTYRTFAPTITNFPVGISGVTVLEDSLDEGSIHHGVITLTHGDSYLRPREQMVNLEETFTSGSQELLYNPSTPSSATYQVFLVEDKSVSDFFESEAVDIGRPHVENPDAEELLRNTSVTYSDAYTLDNSRLTLSSFNPALFPFKDFNPKYGSITYLIDEGTGLVVMHEKKVALQPVNRTLIESAGDGQLVTSKEVLGAERYYASDFGPGRNPESIISRFGQIYFCDAESGRVVQLKEGQMLPISENKMESYFEGLFANLILGTAYPKVPCGFDPENNEYVVTLLQLPTADISIVDAGTTTVIGTAALDNAITEGQTEFEVYAPPQFTNDGITTWDKICFLWEEADLNFRWSNDTSTNLGGHTSGTVYIDLLSEAISVVIEPGLSNSKEVITVDVFTSDGAFTGESTYNLATQRFIIPSALVACSDARNVTVTVTEGNAQEFTTVAYGPKIQFWLTRYSFTPELYANIQNRFFSFNGGIMYRHNTNDTYNEFYGNTFPTTFTIISRGSPSQVKTYNALSLEGDSANWSVALTNNTQAANIGTAEWDEREGMYYTHIGRDEGTDNDNTSFRVHLGEIASIDGTTVTFNSRISNLPFGIGDAVYQTNADATDIVTASATISSVDSRTSITVSSAASLTVGRDLFAYSAARSNGDPIRDYYLQAVLTNAATTEHELHAVNFNFAPSPLHNETNKQ